MNRLRPVLYRVFRWTNIGKTMSECKQDSEDASVVIRAREHKDVWGTRQVLECRECGKRWSE